MCKKSNEIDPINLKSAKKSEKKIFKSGKVQKNTTKIQ